MDRWARIGVAILLYIVVGRGLDVSASSGAIFGDLSDRLIGDGHDTAWIRKLYADPRTEFLPAIATINMKHVEDTAAYRSFLDPGNISIAREYHTVHRAMLRHFEVKTGVPSEIIVAILLIETKCGRESAKAPVLSVLSTIAISASDDQVARNHRLLKATYPELTVSEVRRRAKLRGRWAYRELKALLDWGTRNPREDLPALVGSWAGAVGLPQFMPTSLSAFGVDGDGDGRVDLHDDADAIASICNYLRKNGWRPLKASRGQRRVIWRYNHSPLYVDTVLKVSEEIANSK